jgi:group I intron endonuclease
MGQLYRLDFPNGKSYVGITTKTAEKRFKRHEYSLRYAKVNGPALYSAWRKHGAPTLVVLATVENEDLYETEKRAIAAYGTLYPGGYNLAEGGEAVGSKHPEVRAKMSAALLGRRVYEISAEARAKMSASHLGMKSSDETRAKIGAASKARLATQEARARMSAAQKDRMSSPETRARLSAATKARMASPEVRASMAAAQKARRAARKAAAAGIVPPRLYP